MSSVLVRDHKLHTFHHTRAHNWNQGSSDWIELRQPLENFNHNTGQDITLFCNSIWSCGVSRTFTPTTCIYDLCVSAPLCRVAKSLLAIPISAAACHRLGTLLYSRSLEKLQNRRLWSLIRESGVCMPRLLRNKSRRLVRQGRTRVLQALQLRMVGLALWSRAIAEAWSMQDSGN